MISTLLKYSPVQIISALSVFILIYIHTTYLDPGVYGKLSIVLVILEIIRVFVTQWLNVSMLRIYPGAKLEERVIIEQTVLGMTIIGVVIGVLVLSVVLFAYNYLSLHLYIALSLVFISKSYFMYLIELIRLRDGVSRYRKSMLVQTMSSILLTLIFLHYYPSLESAVFGLFISYVLGLALAASVSWPVLNLEKAKVIVKYGLPIMASGFINTVIMRLDRLILPLFISLTTVGVYSAHANILMGLIGLSFMVVALPIYPDLIKAVDDHVLLRNKHSEYFSIMIAITLPILLLTFFFKDQIFPLILNEGYFLGDDNFFVVLALAIFVGNIKAHYLDHGLQFSMSTEKLLPISISGFLVSIIGSPILISKYGEVGAASTLLMANLMMALLTLISAKRAGYHFLCGIDFYKVCFSVAVVSLFYVVIGYVYDREKFTLIEFSSIICLSAVLYLIILLLLNFLNSRKYFFNK